MAVFPDFKLALTSYTRSFSFLRQHKLLHFFLFPIVLSALLLVGIYFVGDTVIDSLFGLVSGWFSIENWYEWLQVIFEWIITLFVWFTCILLIYKGLKYIIFIALTPILAVLSEKVDTAVTGIEYPFDFQQLIKDVGRGIYIALRNLSIELALSGVLLIATSFIPVISPFTTVFLLLVSWYYIGFSFLDLSNERQRLGIKSRVKDIRKKKGLAYGTGLVFNLIFMIPVLGWIFAPILATTASTLSMLQKEERENLIA